MRNMIITAIVATSLIVGLTAMNASAWGNRGMGPGYGMMYGNGIDGTERRKFLDETKQIRIDIAADQAELAALMAGDNPDSAKVRELSESIANKQITLQEKSREYGWGKGPSNRNFRRGPGYGGGGCGQCVW